MTHEQLVQQLFNRACEVLRIKNLVFRPMNGRVRPVNTKKSFSLGHTSLKRGVVTIDIYTPRFRKPKSYNSILRVIAHEIAHHQKPPFRQRYKGHLIDRQHYPEFYEQVNGNVERFKVDKALGRFFMLN